IVKLLLEEGAPQNSRAYSYLEGEHDTTPLYYAVGRTLDQLITTLLEAGADPSISNGEGETPLTYAAAKGHTQIVKTLLDHGAYLNAHCQAKMLIMAGERAFCDLVEFLIAVGVLSRSNTPLLYTDRAGSEDLVKLLLRGGANTEPYHRVRQTALMSSSRDTIVNPIMRLLRVAANIEARGGRSNRTPLELAASKGYRNIIQLLLTQRAKVDTVSAGHPPVPQKSVESGNVSVKGDRKRKWVNLKDKEQGGERRVFSEKTNTVSIESCLSFLG
ncbi:ankyrin repeat-containing domain protein, partial [Triangularia setosa]